MTFQPTISIVTRTHNRPQMLYECIKSVAALDGNGWEHVILYDDVGSGTKHANSLFDLHKDRVRGKYVYILDDDDRLIYKPFVTEFEERILPINPDIVIVKMFSTLRQRDLPDYWEERRASRGHIGSSCFVVKAEVWKRYIHHFAGGACGDHRFLAAMLENKNLDVIWWNRRIAVIPKEHHGKGGN